MKCSHILPGQARGRLRYDYGYDRPRKGVSFDPSNLIDCTPQVAALCGHGRIMMHGVTRRAKRRPDTLGF